MKKLGLTWKNLKRILIHAKLNPEKSYWPFYQEFKKTKSKTLMFAKMSTDKGSVENSHAINIENLSKKPPEFQKTIENNLENDYYE